MAIVSIFIGTSAFPLQYMFEHVWTYSNMPACKSVGHMYLFPSEKGRLYKQEFLCFQPITGIAGQAVSKCRLRVFPRSSMYGIFTNIYPINGPNVGKYTIHGWSGLAYLESLVIYKYVAAHSLLFFLQLNFIRCCLRVVTDKNYQLISIVYTATMMSFPLPQHIFVRSSRGFYE